MSEAECGPGGIGYKLNKPKEWVKKWELPLKVAVKTTTSLNLPLEEVLGGWLGEVAGTAGMVAAEMAVEELKVPAEYPSTANATEQVKTPVELFRAALKDLWGHLEKQESEAREAKRTGGGSGSTAGGGFVFLEDSMKMVDRQRMDGTTETAWVKKSNEKAWKSFGKP